MVPGFQEKFLQWANCVVLADISARHLHKNSVFVVELWLSSTHSASSEPCYCTELCYCVSDLKEMC